MFNFISFGSLISTVFMSMAVYFIFNIKHRSKASTYLGIMFAYEIIHNASIMVGFIIYNPLAAYHRWFGALFAMLTILQPTQFFFHFPETKKPKLALYLMLIQYLIVITVGGLFIKQTLSLEKVFITDGQFWNVVPASMDKLYALTLLIFLLLYTIVAVWRIITSPGRRKEIIMFLITFLSTSLLPTITSQMVRRGSVSVEIFYHIWNLSCIIGWFLVIIFYINSTNDRTSFMDKVIGVSLVTFFVIMLAIGYGTLGDKDRDYNLIHQQRAHSIIYDKNFRSDDFEYIKEIQYRKNLPVRDIKQDEKIIKHYMVFYYSDTNGRRTYEVGFNYITYRKYIHDAIVRLIIIFFIVLIFILAGYPVFFFNTLIKPLNRLRDGLRRVMNGEFDFNVKIKVEDEIGFITHSFNKMVSTIKNAKMQIDEYTNTLEKRVEERTLELRLSEERYRNILESIEECYFEVDINGNFTFFNDAFCNELLYQRDELLGMNYKKLHTDDTARRVFNLYNKIYKGEVTHGFIECEIKRKDGVTRVVESSISLIKDDSGRGIGFRAVGRDITERKKAEEAIKELNTQKSRFFANISHEIRTPLTLILSPIEFALQGDYAKPVDKQFLENLQKNGLRLLKLINNLLDFSKLEAGKMNLKIEEANIVKFIRNYISLVISTAESRNIKIEFFPGKIDIKNLYFDLDKMDKVMMNLFSNSLKFTESGGEIIVRIKEDDIYCYIEFEDTGVGIPSEKIDRIFERFSQVYSTAARKYEGTGIGLSLVKELIHLHGGTISAKSRFIEEHPDDHGTIFYITLLKGKEHFQSIDNVEFIATSEFDGPIKDHRFVGMREMSDLKINKEISSGAESDEHENISTLQKFQIEILIVEDNPDMRDFLESILESEYALSFAENGEEGLNRIKELNPDLIITDVMMPVMNGYEMTKKIKEDNELKQIPVIMLTAKADITNRIEGLEQGADDYLSKPFNTKELLTRIKMLLKTSMYQRIISKRNIEIEGELEIARLIQEKLLPQNIPEISGYRSYVKYIPMDKVGGDFYDYSLSDNKLELFIADVSGHGLPGAFLSLIAKMALESFPNRSSPSRVLYHLNDIVFRSTVKHNYITAFYGILDTFTNIFKFSNAGHFPPLVFRQNSNEFIELKTKGKPLGWFKNIKLEENELVLFTGDRLLLYTDGIIECKDSHDELYGIERFKDFVRTRIHLSPEDFIENLLETLYKYSNTNAFDDDLTIIVFDVL